MEEWDICESVLYIESFELSGMLVQSDFAMI